MEGEFKAVVIDFPSRAKSIVLLFVYPDDRLWSLQQACFTRHSVFVRNAVAKNTKTLITWFFCCQSQRNFECRILDSFKIPQPAIHVLFRVANALRYMRPSTRLTRFIVCHCFYHARQLPRTQEGLQRVIRMYQGVNIVSGSHKFPKVLNWRLLQGLSHSLQPLFIRIFLQKLWNMLKQRLSILVWKKDLKRNFSDKDRFILLNKILVSRSHRISFNNIIRTHNLLR